MLDKKSKIFLSLFAFLAMISLVVTFYRYVVLKNFTIFTDEEVFNSSLEE